MDNLPAEPLDPVARSVNQGGVRDPARPTIQQNEMLFTSTHNYRAPSVDTRARRSGRLRGKPPKREISYDDDERLLGLRVLQLLHLKR